MGNWLLVAGFGFLLVRWGKTIVFIQNIKKYDAIKSYFLLPEFVLFIAYLYSILQITNNELSDSKLVVLGILFLGVITSSIGFRWKNKISIVLSIILFMYAFGICLTKSPNFMMP